MSDIFDEPHMQSRDFQSDPSEAKTVKTSDPEEYAARNSIWDEPGLSTTLVGRSDTQGQTYKGWLERGLAETSELKSWLLVCALVLVAGPAAVIGTFLSSNYGGVLALVVFGPAIEEVLKVGAAALVLEQRPYFFRNKAQLIAACLAGALGFAIIENLIYLNVYIPDPSEQLVLWRWTVCVALHVCATAIATLGLVKVWDQVFTEYKPSRLQLARPYLVAAIILHGCYNAFALSINGVFTHL